MFRRLSFRSGPVAEPTSPEAARRIGVIDIGSNSVRLVVFESATRSPTVFFNEKALCGLGDQLETTGRLSSEGATRAIATLKRFMTLAARMRLDGLCAVGTAAVREAADGPEFVARIEREVGLRVEVASGADEARLAAQGVILGEPTAEGVVADLGGASLELVAVTRAGAGAPPTPGEGVTTPLGPLRLQAVLAREGKKGLEAHIERVLAETTRGRFERGGTLYVLGGSWRALARAHMLKHDYELEVLHGYSLGAEAATAMARWGAGLSVSDLRDLSDVSESRAKVTALAALTLGKLIAAIGPARVTLSAFGLREGVLWERMPASLRAVDPLLDACRAIERTKGRAPGFGAELWSWLRGPLGRLSGLDARLAEAACLLSDAVWETHPDYRGQASFELVTRNNFGGVDHPGRLFIGAALVHRTKGAKRFSRAEAAVKRLGADALARAEALGRGMRLGVTLAGGAAGLLPRTRLRIDEEAVGGPRLELLLAPDVADLAGEEVDKRLEAFAHALGCAGARVAVGEAALA